MTKRQHTAAPIPPPNSKDIRPQNMSSAKSALLLSVMVLVILLIIVVNFIWNTIDKARVEVDKEAEVAATVIGRTAAETPIAQLAYEVVGSKGNTTIEALQAEGTNYKGELVLRITVDNTNPDLVVVGRDYAQHCYRYSFHHAADTIEPQKLDTCPSGSPLQLSSPPLKRTIAPDVGG